MCWLCVFCFFKQKTAYEMRISDWSSDVCSSDLEIFRPSNDASYVRRLSRPPGPGARPYHGSSRRGARMTVWGVALLVRGRRRAPTPVAARVGAAGEIGIGSCREGVGLYWEISVFAVYVKKKTTNIDNYVN